MTAPQDQRRNPKLHVFSIRIYYEDTDFSGFVYHANYLRFMERARTEWVRGTGFEQSAAFAASPPISFIVKRLSLEYLRPARMDDVIAVETRLVEARGASMALAQAILRGDETLVTAEVTVVSLAAGRPARLPRLIREALPGGSSPHGGI